MYKNYENYKKTAIKIRNSNEVYSSTPYNEKQLEYNKIPQYSIRWKQINLIGQRRTNHGLRARRTPITASAQNKHERPLRLAIII